MADRKLKHRDLRRILRRYGVEWDPKPGKGSHGVFFKKMDGGVLTYPVPRNLDTVEICYVKGCRKRFKLRPEDGVNDDEFYTVASPPTSAPTRPRTRALPS